VANAEIFKTASTIGVTIPSDFLETFAIGPPGGHSHARHAPGKAATGKRLPEG
jgi:hypothetical protein